MSFEFYNDWFKIIRILQFLSALFKKFNDSRSFRSRILKYNRVNILSMIFDFSKIGLNSLRSYFERDILHGLKDLHTDIETNTASILLFSSLFKKSNDSRSFRSRILKYNRVSILSMTFDFLKIGLNSLRSYVWEIYSTRTERLTHRHTDKHCFNSVILEFFTLQNYWFNLMDFDEFTRVKNSSWKFARLPKFL